MAKCSSDIRAVVELHAHTYQLPMNLVLALCHTESSFEPWAFRYEPGYRWLVGDKLNMTITEKFGQMCSWGLMQVMGGVARELGFAGPFPQLCEPDLAVQYGCRHFKKYFDRWQQWDDAIASYNAGSPRKLSNGLYINQEYVKKVHAAWNAFDIEHAEI